MTEPPDFPRRDPTPSMAAFPFSLDSELRGTKATSFVASKRVYLVARAITWCSEPKKILNIRGVEVKKAASCMAHFSDIVKKKKAAPVRRSIAAGTIAAIVHDLRMKLLVKKTAMIVAMTPITVKTSPM